MIIITTELDNFTPAQNRSFHNPITAWRTPSMKDMSLNEMEDIIMHVSTY